MFKTKIKYYLFRPPDASKKRRNENNKNKTASTVWESARLCFCYQCLDHSLWEAPSIITKPSRRFPKCLYRHSSELRYKSGLPTLNMACNQMIWLQNRSHFKPPDEITQSNRHPDAPWRSWCPYVQQSDSLFYDFRIDVGSSFLKWFWRYQTYAKAAIELYR